MKKLLSVFCMAVLAGGLLFSSCGKNFTITVNVNNEGWGTVTGAGSYAENATATIAATPNAGYTFVKWQDGNTDNPRTITVTGDATYTAIFEAIPVEPTVNVTFDGSNWTAGAIQSAYYVNYGSWDVYARQNESSAYPTADVCMYTDKNTGSVSDNCSENGQFSNESDFGWVEYYKETYLVDGNNNPYGDWWAKSATTNVAAFDATSLTMSANTTATMFDAVSALTGDAPVGVDAAATAPMTVNMVNITLTENNAGGKASMRKHYTKLSVVK